MLYIFSNVHTNNAKELEAFEPNIANRKKTKNKKLHMVLNQSQEYENIKHLYINRILKSAHLYVYVWQGLVRALFANLCSFVGSKTIVLKI